MSIKHTLVDWLGNVLDEEATPAKSSTSSGELRCYWMEVAREVIESYAIAALQLSPIRIYQTADGEESTGHDSWLWNVSPNPNQSRADFMSELLHRALNDEDGALVVPIRIGGTTTLWIADGFNVDVKPGREDVYRYISVNGSTEATRKSYRARDVYRFKLNPPGWNRYLALATDEYQRLGTFASNAFADSGASRYKLRTQIPVNGGQKQMDKVAEYIEQSLKPFITGERGVLPTYKDFDLERLGGASSAASWRKSEDIIAIRKDMFDAVAMCFRVPVSLMYGNTNNFESVWTSFMTFFANPLMRGIEDEIARKSLDEADWSRGAHVVVDTTHVKHVDIFDVADKVEKLVGSSIDTPNEIRSFTRQQPVKADGMDDYQRTKNFETAGGGVENA